MREALDPDQILAGDYAGAADVETMATVACALIAVMPSHWLGPDHEWDCSDLAVSHGVVFG